MLWYGMRCTSTIAKCCDRDGRASPMLRASPVCMSMSMHPSWSSANTSKGGGGVHGEVRGSVIGIGCVQGVA